MLYLTLHTPPSLPLELDGVLPENLATLTVDEIARRPVLHGNRSEELGTFFTITGNAMYGEMLIRGECSRVKRIGAGMTAGRIVVEGDVGFHAGAEMRGGELCIQGNASDWLGAEISGGLIRVSGNAGDQAGAAYRGSRQGVRGGTILIQGNTGDETGLLMRRGLIAIGGNCGSYAGASMIAGTLVLMGKAGRAAGAGMKRGTMIVGYEPELGPGFRFSCEYRPTFLGLFAERLRELRFEHALHLLSRLVRCYRGDVVNRGAGELLILG